MPDEIRKLPEAIERERKAAEEKAADAARKQATVNTNQRKQALAEVKETIAMMREMDPNYSIDADGIAAMVDDRVARIKAGQ